MVARILLGLVLMAGGVAAIYFANPMVEHLWRNARAEEHVGGTKNLIILIGFGLIVVGGLFMLGVVNIGVPANELQNLTNLESGV